MSSPIKWYGGKATLASKLLPLIPDHTAYVEVFGGSGALLFAKQHSRIEVYNDLDSGLVQFFRVLQDDTLFERFCRMVNTTLFSRELYNEYRVSWRTETDRVVSAAQWFMIARQSFSGIFGMNWAGVSKQQNQTLAWLNVIKELPAFHERLMRVQIEHRDWEWILEHYDSDNTFFYLDPPYMPSTRRDQRGYQHNLTESDHQLLVERIQELKGKALLSGYRTELYDSLSWNRTDFNVMCKVPNSKYGSDNRRTESVWQNYETQMSLF